MQEDSDGANGNYAIRVRGTLEIHFFGHPELVPAESSAGCYFRVLDLDALHRAFENAKLPRTGIPRQTLP